MWVRGISRDLGRMDVPAPSPDGVAHRLLWLRGGGCPVNTLFISARQVAARLARGERLVFVDCRSDDACRMTDRGLPGAVRAPPGSLADAADHLLGRGGTAVAYGEDGWDESAPRLVEFLRARGWTHVRILAGGLHAWSALRSPADPARAPLPLT